MPVKAPGDNFRGNSRSTTSLHLLQLFLGHVFADEIDAGFKTDALNFLQFRNL
jgi:hypothetical protein